MDEIRQYYKIQPDEIFRRISITSLVSLMLEVSKLEYQIADTGYEADGEAEAEPETVQSHLSSSTPDDLETDSLNKSFESLATNEEFVDSIVFKGKKIRKGSGGHHFSSIGDLLQV